MILDSNFRYLFRTWWWLFLGVRALSWNMQSNVSAKDQTPALTLQEEKYEIHENYNTTLCRFMSHFKDFTATMVIKNNTKNSPRNNTISVLSTDDKETPTLILVEAISILAQYAEGEPEKGRLEVRVQVTFTSWYSAKKNHRHIVSITENRAWKIMKFFVSTQYIKSLKKNSRFKYSE